MSYLKQSQQRVRERPPPPLQTPTVGDLILCDLRRLDLLIYTALIERPPPPLQTSQHLIRFQEVRPRTTRKPFRTFSSSRPSSGRSSAFSHTFQPSSRILRTPKETLEDQRRILPEKWQASGFQHLKTLDDRWQRQLLTHSTLYKIQLENTK